LHDRFIAADHFHSADQPVTAIAAWIMELYFLMCYNENRVLANAARPGFCYILECVK
jgi:hypothetical protein